MYVLILCAYFVGVCSVKLQGGRKAFLETKAVLSVSVMVDHTLISYCYLEKSQKVTGMNH